MFVFRLSKKKYASELSGRGASLSNNRWNSKGTELIYTANSRALAMAEVAVHLSIATLPRDYVMMEIEIPDLLKIDQISIDSLEEDWNRHPHSFNTQIMGDTFIHENKTCVLKVPSAVVKDDFNYLLNPKNKNFDKIKIVTISDFPFDERLFV